MNHMVYCPACSEQQDDVKSFCRFCGGILPGVELMLKLRNESIALASNRNGKSVSQSHSETQKTISAVQANANNSSTHKVVNNGVHLNSTKLATDSLKGLMRDI